MSHSMYRRRRWRTFATTLALTLGSLAVPAAALADGPADAATVDDRLQQIIPLRDRLIAEDPDAARLAFAVLAALYEHRLFPVCRPA